MNGTVGGERLLTITKLIALGCGGSAVVVSTAALGRSLGVSQQAASLRLQDLEDMGFVERTRRGKGAAVRVTDKGMRAASALYLELGSALEGRGVSFEFKGEVFSGLGEGAYYVSLPGYARGFRAGLGFTPFPGTLNLKLSDRGSIERRRELAELPGVVVPGFSDNRRTFGPVKCFKAMVQGRQAGGVLAIERTHYDSSVIEVIAPVSLRKSLKLGDRSACSVTVYPAGGGQG
jgi:riboflavin kinase, archaea type